MLVIRRRRPATSLDEANSLLRVAQFPILKESAKQAAGGLSGGEQQLLASTRGLMARPKMLLVDEPTVGVAPLLVQELGRSLREINQ